MDGIRRSLGKYLPLLLVVFSSSEAFGFSCYTGITNSINFQTCSLDRSVPSILASSRIQSQTAKTTTQLFSSSPSNPFSSIIGDFAQSIMGKSDTVTANPQLDSSLQAIMAASSAKGSSSWSDIRSQLESVQTPEERKFRDNLVKGYGEGSPMHKVRLYDESNEESDIRVTFYRDHASWWYDSLLLL